MAGDDFADYIEVGAEGADDVVALAFFGGEAVGGGKGVVGYVLAADSGDGFGDDAGRGGGGGEAVEFIWAVGEI